MIQIRIIKPGEDFSDAMKIRIPVFVEEQKVPKERELDENDKLSYHAVLFEDEIPVACGRLYFTDNIAHIGRVAVLKDYRRKGYATKICKKLIDISISRKINDITLDAQKYVVGLYEKLGFKVVSDEFLEENMPHFKMELIFAKKISVFDIICIAVSIISWIMLFILFSILNDAVNSFNVYLNEFVPDTSDIFDNFKTIMTIYIGVAYIFLYSISPPILRKIKYVISIPRAAPDISNALCRPNAFPILPFSRLSLTRTSRGA